MPGRLTIGLYNSYDPRRLTEAHRRALARAAPLALAFDANLVAFGFPWDAAAGDLSTGRGGAKGGPLELSTPLDIARFVASTTSVGEGGDYFVRLAEDGRFQTFDLPRKGFPPQLGEVVLTTEHATGPKSTTPRDVAAALVAGRSQLLVFGLGPHGVPKDVHAMAARELDVTGRNLSFETATALGAVVAAIDAHRDAMSR
ncbi:MAG TPA: DUF531 family protein [Candidatus Thermoplasmatota archaeon]|nr:DUF531 family protein [Candidatus Thermoplasmatota archaeon]